MLKPVLVPSLLYTLSRELVLPILPLFATRFTTKSAEFGVLVSCYALGRLFANIPAGVAVSLFGLRNVFLLAYCAEITAATVVLLGDSLAALMVSQVVSGAAMAIFDLCRQVYVARYLELEMKARLSMVIGGIRRGMVVVAPLCSGLVIQLSDQRYVFAVQIAISLLNCLWCLCYIPTARAAQASIEPLREEEQTKAQAEEPVEEEDVVAESQCASYKSVFVNNWWLLCRIGVFTFALQVFRASTGFTFPYQGLQMGLTESVTASVVSFRYLVDVLMVPIGGWLIESKGRKSAALVFCSFACIGFIAFGLLAREHSALGNWALPLFYGIGCLSGLTNGVTAGLVMTIAQDIAHTIPLHRREHLVALYKILTDCGSILGPLVVGLLTTSSFGTALFILSGFFALMMLWIVKVMVRYMVAWHILTLIPCCGTARNEKSGCTPIHFYWQSD